MWITPPILVSLTFSVLLCITISCTSSGKKSSSSSRSASDRVASRAKLGRSINLEIDLLPANQKGRRTWKTMRPKYITIHTTQNRRRGADARRHALALKRGKILSGRGSGYLTWHFTVDSRRAVQHLKTTEQGEHADFDGPGNRTSIGIEICENPDGSLTRSIDRAAKLTAVMMKAHRIPLRNVVPHYHWPRIRNGRVWHKPCPRPLLDNGRPGRKWAAFKSKVNRYYRQL